MAIQHWADTVSDSTAKAVLKTAVEGLELEKTAPPAQMRGFWEGAFKKYDERIVRLARLEVIKSRKGK